MKLPRQKYEDIIFLLNSTLFVITLNILMSESTNMYVVLLRATKKTFNILPSNTFVMILYIKIDLFQSKAIVIADKPVYSVA